MRHKPVAIHGDDLADRIESDADDQTIADYGVRRGRRTVHLVSWPEHVINPRYNSDATYHGVVGRATTQRGLEMIARRHGADVYRA